MFCLQDVRAHLPHADVGGGGGELKLKILDKALEGGRGGGGGVGGMRKGWKGPSTMMVFTCRAKRSRRPREADSSRLAAEATAAAGGEA